MRRYSNSATNVNGLLHEFLHGKEVSYICMQKTPEKYKTKEIDFIMFKIEAFCSEINTQTKYDKGSLKVNIFSLKSKSLRNTN